MGSYMERLLPTIRVAVWLRLGSRFLASRLGPILHHEVLHRLRLLLWSQQRTRLDFADLRLQNGLGILKQRPSISERFGFWQRATTTNRVVAQWSGKTSRGPGTNSTALVGRVLDARFFVTVNLRAAKHKLSVRSSQL